MSSLPSSLLIDESDESRWSYYGWRVVLAAQLGVLAGFGSLFVYTFSVFLKPLAAQFGWSREAVSNGFALAAITVGVCSPALGRALDRVQPRRIILPCMVVFGAGVACLGFLRAHLWQFYAMCILVGIVGNGAAQLAYSRAIVTWFRKRLGMALALVMVGSGIGSMILPFAAQVFINHWGWRVAYFLLGALALVLGLPLTWKYVHDRKDASDAGRPAMATAGVRWRQGFISFPFLVIVTALVLNSASVNGVLAHLSAMLTDRGISGEGAALGIAVLGTTSLVGRLIVGGMLDRFTGSRVACLMLMSAAAGILMLSRAATLSTGCIATGLIGIGMGAEADITPYLLNRYFGLASFSTLYGLTWTFYAFAGGIGPVLLGYTFDSKGSYASILVFLSLAAALAALLMLLLPPYPDHGCHYES